MVTPLTYYPSSHFPRTPAWAQTAIDEAIARAGVNAEKWRVPLGAIGRYESNFRPAANLCVDDLSLPVGLVQQGRSFYRAALEEYPEMHVGLNRTLDDPVRSFLVAILHIDSALSVSGGYGGIGRLDGNIGLLPRTDRGPGNVLRAWVTEPRGFDIEAARALYRGY